MKRMKIAGGLALALLSAACMTAKVRPVWHAESQDDGANVWALPDGERLRIDVLDAGLFRVRKTRGGVWTESGLDRYGFLEDDWKPVKAVRKGDRLETAGAVLTVDAAKGTVSVGSRVSPADFTAQVATPGDGFALSFSLADDERIYGLGDVDREHLQRRPGRYEIWVKNNLSYIPMSMALSSLGWGFMVNTTYRHFVDVGAKRTDALAVEAPTGDADFYVFTGKDYRALLETYTRLVGRPALLPAFAYGLTFVCNQWIDNNNAVRDAYAMNKEEIPCDAYGLEPGWMETFYDKTTRKTWSKARFGDIPGWCEAGDHIWPSALKRMGFKLSLWLCCDYDLFRYEEQKRAGLAAKSGKQVEIPAGITENWEDTRITNGNGNPLADSPDRQPDWVLLDRPELNHEEGQLPWFEHLKKFVDQGARCFKLDGAWQVTEHADRVWSNGMSDEEAHNLYPLVYARQMAKGFEDYTDTRAFVYSAGGYNGFGQYVASWAGDTGGGSKPLVSMLNLGLSGHSNHSCDMRSRDVEGIHFGFLQTWSQLANWDYWYQPWMDAPEKVETFRKYDQLRYRLFPYLYAAAAEASRTGWPVMRALPLVHPDVAEYADVKTTYYLGPDLLVSAFADETVIPPGDWFDFRTGEKVMGPARVKVAKTADWGGGLYVRAGAVIPTWPQKLHIDRGWNDEVVFHVWPSADGACELYEDDGESLACRTGGCARTPVTLKVKDGRATLSVGSRRGAFEGAPAALKTKAVFHLPGNRLEARDFNKTITIEL